MIEKQVMADLTVLMSRQEIVDMASRFEPIEKEDIKQLIAVRQRELKRLDNMLSRAIKTYEAGEYDVAVFLQRREAIQSKKLAIANDLDVLQKQLQQSLSHKEIMQQVKVGLGNSQSIADLVEDLYSRYNIKDGIVVEAKGYLQKISGKIIVNGVDDIIIYYLV